MPQPIRASDLLEHLDWARALAHSLLRDDPSAADDAVQDAWIAVTRNPPPEKAAIRPWLATILRRGIGKRTLGEQRRSAREERAARDESIEATVDVVARAAAHRDVVDALMKLGEPYRSTLVLRYFEGLGPSAIAEREGIPLDTVRSHLRRGLDKLRSDLDRETGDQPSTRRMLLALAGPTLIEIAAATAGVSPTTKAVAAAVTILVVGAASHGFFLATENGPSPNSLGIASSDNDTKGSDAGLERGDVGATTVPLRVESAVSTKPLTKSTGRVVDTSGAPLGGFVLRRDGPHTVRWQGGDIGWIANDLTARRVDAQLESQLHDDAAFAELWFEQFSHPEEWRATMLGTPIPDREIETSSDGTFPLIALPRSDDEAISEMGFTSASGEHVLVARGVDTDGMPTWVVARAKDVSGRTLDIGGATVEDSFVQWNFETGIAACEGLERIDFVLRSTEVRSDSNGRYLLRRVPVTGPLVILRARTNAGLTAERALNPAIAPSFDLCFGPGKNVSTIALAGIVLDPRGQPVKGASVAAGRLTTETQANGEFAFDEVPLDRGIALTAWMIGYVPVRHSSLRDALSSGRLPPASIVLQLRHEARTLRGRIIDEGGAAVDGASIALENPTQLDITFTPLEARVGGRERCIVSKGGGAFEMSGLGMRPYRLRLWKDGVALLVSEPIDPTALDVTLTVDAPRKRHGRAVDIDGRPLAHARLALEFRTFANRSGSGTMSETSGLTQTDANGNFEFALAPQRFGVIHLEAKDGTRSVHPLASQPGAGELLLRHDNSKRYVQIIPAPELGCDRARFLDKDGNLVEIEVHAHQRIERADVVHLETPFMPWIAIPRLATTLVLFDGLREIQRSTIPADGSVLRGSY